MKPLPPVQLHHLDLARGDFNFTIYSLTEILEEHRDNLFFIRAIKALATFNYYVDKAVELNKQAIFEAEKGGET